MVLLPLLDQFFHTYLRFFTSQKMYYILAKSWRLWNSFQRSQMGEQFYFSFNHSEDAINRLCQHTCSYLSHPWTLMRNICIYFEGNWCNNTHSWWSKTGLQDVETHLHFKDKSRASVCRRLCFFWFINILDKIVCD